jgi:hypothetical protein
VTFDCRDLERALASDDGRLLEEARLHAEHCAACREELELWNDVSAAARTLHREWESPALWPATAARLRSQGDAAASRGWWPVAASWRLAAAAALTLMLGTSAAWLAWRSFARADRGGRVVTSGPLLSDEALSDIERAETEYIRAIEKLAKTAAPRVAAPASPLAANLRERLIVIDAAIAECRGELDRNRFNAHLRKQLLEMYREKRRTLEQILEQGHDL